jgi:hypothetical protein
MGFLDAQLAQGYALAYSQRAGLLDSEDRNNYNTILNGIQMADNILSFGLETRETEIKRPARPGEYRVDTAKEIRSRIAQYQTSAGNFEIKLRFRASRTMTREQRYKRDVGERSNRKIPRAELDAWELRTAASRVARRAILRRIILREIGYEIIQSIARFYVYRPDLAARRGRQIGLLRKLNKFRKELRVASRLWRTLSKAARESRAVRLARSWSRLG